MCKLVTFYFFVPGPIVSTVLDLLSILKGSWLYLGDEGSGRERKLGSYIFLFHLVDTLELLVHYYKKGDKGFVFDSVGQRESVLLIK